MSAQPSEPVRLLAGPHNSRLGPAIHAFNLPAEPEVCVGATPACSTACYARSFLFRLQLQRHRRNHERSRDAGFARRIISEIRRGLVRIVRIHTSGDFYDAEYVGKWLEVARVCPDTVFFAYTRSWRSEEILTELIGLAGLPNVSLWFSEDRDSGPSPRVAGVRRAYLLGEGEAEGGVPAEADLVFRVAMPRRPGQATTYAGPSKRANGILICPKEQGIVRKVQITCSSCRICFSGPIRRRLNPCGREATAHPGSTAGRTSEAPRGVL